MFEKEQQSNTQLTLKYEKEIQIIKEASKNEEFSQLTKKLDEINLENADKEKLIQVMQKEIADTKIMQNA